MRAKGQGPRAKGEPMADLGGFEKLIAWRKSFELSKEVYEATQGFPADERFGLTSQMRRAAVSVPSNIAEGWGRGSRADYLRHLGISRGSLYELYTQARLANELGYLQRPAPLLEQLAEVGRILNGLIRSLRPDDND